MTTVDALLTTQGHTGTSLRGNVAFMTDQLHEVAHTTRRPAPSRLQTRRKPTTSLVKRPRTSDGSTSRSQEVTITHELSLTGELAEQLWVAYHTNFAPLAKLAIQKQSSERDEMIACFANPNFIKIVAWQAGVPVGFGLVTNVLEEVPEISPDFLRSKYPEHAARNAIFVGIYVMVAPGQRGLTLFSRLYTEMWQIPASVGGKLVFDICDFNRTMFDTDQLVNQIAGAFPQGSVSVVDRQTWYVADLPEPIPSMPRRAMPRRESSRPATKSNS